VRLAARDAPLDLPAIERVAGARIEKSVSLLLRLGPLCVEVLRRAEAGLGVAALDQLVRARHVTL
jgi:hypothetical protein